jgi:hypothetical protein
MYDDYCRDDAQHYRHRKASDGGVQFANDFVKFLFHVESDKIWTQIYNKNAKKMQICFFFYYFDKKHSNENDKKNLR